jgi:hypothetical protein
MNDLEKKEFEDMKRKLALLEGMFVITPTMIRIKRTVQIDGRINADRVYTQRSGNYVELTS